MRSMKELIGKVIEGDCLEVIASIPNGSVDFIFSALAYTMMGTVCEIEMDLQRMWREYGRIAKPCGTIALSCHSMFVGKLISSNEELFRMKIRCTTRLPGKDFGGRRIWKHTDVLIFSTLKGMAEYSLGHTAGVIFNEFSIESLMDTASIDLTRTNGKAVRRKRLPEAFAHYLIQTFTEPGDFVLDTACGTGTFLVAAHKEGRRVVGIEQSEFVPKSGPQIGGIKEGVDNLENLYA
jgi:site-specific DNA-methyltransferase (adenine-specific)